VAFSPDGKSLAAGVTQHARPTGEFVAGEVLIWDAVTGQMRFALSDSHHVNGVAFSPDGKYVASACLSGTLKVWDTTNGQVICTLKGHTESVNTVTFSPDGKRIASASDDQTVRIWDAMTGQEALTLKDHTGAVYSVAFSPDGRRIASVSQDHTLKVWGAARVE
jgi:WD40 repeat protein